MAGAATPPRTATVTITELAAGGDGVGRVDGLAVFVPRTAVGDVVEVQLAARGRFARGRVLALTHPSPDRVLAPCPHFDAGCGGCDWQHVAHEAQREAKRRIVHAAFARIAHRDIPVPALVGDRATFGYRRALRFTTRDGTAFGFHAEGAPERIVPIDECLLARPVLTEVWRMLYPRVQQDPRLLPDSTDAARAPIQLALRELDGGEVVVVVHNGARWNARAAHRLAEGIPHIVAVLWQQVREASPSAGRSATRSASPGGAPHRVVQHAPRVMWSRATSDEAVHHLQLAASFVQVNASMAPTLHAMASQAVLARQPAHIIDAYAGAGAHSDAAYARGVRVTAIEWDAAACAALRARRESPSSVHAGAVETLLPTLLQETAAPHLPVEAVLLNPPRGGVDAAVTTALAAACRTMPSLKRLVYVSCDPATLARDVARLDGWRVVDVQCVDMFPHTAHVETVCVLEPGAPAEPVVSELSGT